MRQITSDVYMLEHVGSAPAFLLTVPTGATLIDTGMPGRIKPLLAEIEATQQPLNAIQQIVLTHCHADHTGNVAELVKRTQAKVIAHQNDVQPGWMQPGSARRLPPSRAWSSLGRRWAKFAAGDPTPTEARPLPQRRSPR